MLSDVLFEVVFQFLLGCYMCYRAREKARAVVLSIPFGMLLIFSVVNMTADFIAFNSFWDATRTGLGVHSTSGRLSIPFGMLPYKDGLCKCASSYYFQFLLGCYF